MFSAIIRFFGSLLVFTVCTIYKPPFFQISEAARQSCKTYWLVGFHLEYFIFDSDAKKNVAFKNKDIHHSEDRNSRMTLERLIT